MRVHLAKTWETVWTSLWFLPTVLVGLAIIVASLLLAVDGMFVAGGNALTPWVFSGTADAARTVLATIAGSLITVISVAFSITIVALQQAAVQFTPRVLRTFIADHTNQVVLGTYTATFVYALLVLRAVRSPSETRSAVGFVPGLSVTLALLLAVLCLGLLIVFLHHIAQSLQVTLIIDQVHAETVRQIEARYPQRIVAPHVDPSPLAPPLGGTAALYAERSGVIQAIDVGALRAVALDPLTILWVRPALGDYVSARGVLATFVGGTVPDEAAQHRLRAAFILGKQRSPTLDPTFGLRQLVDIALKALSPGINDPTTAEEVLNALGDLLGRLAERELAGTPSAPEAAAAHVMVTEPTWATFVTDAFGQVRAAAVADLHVTLHLIGVLQDLACHVPAGNRGQAVAQQLAAIGAATPQQAWLAEDQAQVRHGLTAALAALPPSP